MTAPAQEKVVQFLSALDNGNAEIISTHISIVVLTKDRAFKLKREVVFPYLDFSTPERRLAMCEREFALNRRTAPALYLAVRRVTREANGELVFDGEGEFVDAVIEMRRFEQDQLFDRLALRGALTAPMIETLSQRIASFHDLAPADFSRGGLPNMLAQLDLGEASSLAQAKLVAPQDLAALSQNLRETALRLGPLLDARRAAGKVRRCHGDLTLHNICLLDGEPTPFDCLEFSDDLATIDVLYDLAFLLMDLWRRDQLGFANLALNRYLDYRDETDGLPLLPYFMALRAAIRAEVAASRFLQSDSDRAELAKEARDYCDLACSLLRPSNGRVIAIGGRSGSGKSSVAARLAPRIGPAPGARIVNSDRLRKKLFGVRPSERLPQTAYEPHVSSRVYEGLRDEAKRVAASGWPIIIDAVFDRPEDRAAIEKAAQEAKAPFHGIWLDLSREELLRRVEARRNDVSDATVDVLALQFERDPGDIGWMRIDAGRDLDAIAAEIASRLAPGEPTRE
jgi:aminoglycoside phosphotransferase family enzyme/predicted kinase